MKTLTLALGALLTAQGATAQSLEHRIASAKGTVGFEFNTRANVCGNGMMIRISDDSSAGWTMRSRQSGITIGRSDDRELTRCDEAPARVVLTRADGKVTGVVVTVGGRADRADTQLGVVNAPEAARYLLSIAPGLDGRAGNNAVTGAAIADSISTWKRMLEIARDNGASESSRKSTMFWISHEAGAVATAGLRDVAMDDNAEISVRKDALFFLSQRKADGVPGLIKVVRESKSASLRKDAIWHLSQSKDPRALDLFEQLLAGK